MELRSLAGWKDESAPSEWWWPQFYAEAHSWTEKGHELWEKPLRTPSILPHIYPIYSSSYLVLSLSLSLSTCWFLPFFPSLSIVRFWFVCFLDHWLEMAIFIIYLAVSFGLFWCWNMREKHGLKVVGFYYEGEGVFRFDSL